ncbi:YfbU family protein [Parvibaculum sp.]|uniref:YfbU family protein n=1 Tax=Parvibaculum sp. TaxID=2024848 RepID=UPI000CC9335A|nr:MAG: hypothetical protein CVT81_14670 [Alphaproteobacteria bacterium HGW-Alphaproteobacteria-3]
MPPKSERFELRLDAEILEQVDNWRAEQGDLPSRSEAVRRLIEKGLDLSATNSVKISDGEKLILMILGDMTKHLKIKREIDHDFLASAIYGGHYWGLEWEYSGLFHRHVDRRKTVSEVVDILDMWTFIERGYAELSKKEKERVETEAKPFGKHVTFAGFDGNNEGEHRSVAQFLIDDLGRFSRFKGRDLDSHSTSVPAYRRMLSVFLPIRPNLVGRELSASEIIEMLQAKIAA